MLWILSKLSLRAVPVVKAEPEPDSPKPDSPHKKMKLGKVRVSHGVQLQDHDTQVPANVLSTDVPYDGQILGTDISIADSTHDTATIGRQHFLTSLKLLELVEPYFFEMMPLEIGVAENGWTQGFSKDKCFAALGTAGKFQASINVLWLSVMDGWKVTPYFRNVVSAYRHFWADTRDKANDSPCTLHACIGDPLWHSFDDKIGNGPAISKDARVPHLLANQLKVLGAHELLWAFFMGLPQVSPKDIEQLKKWANVARSLVVHIHATSTKSAQVIVDWQAEENMRATMTALESDGLRKAATLTQLTEAMVSDGMATTQVAVSASMNMMQWQDRTTEWTSTRVISALQAIHLDMVLRDPVWKVYQRIQYCFGKRIFDVWKLHGILKTLTDSSLLVDAMERMYWSLVRGIIVSIHNLGVQQLRGTPKQPGIVSILCCRCMIIDWALKHFQFGDKVMHAFSNFRCYKQPDLTKLARHS